MNVSFSYLAHTWHDSSIDVNIRVSNHSSAALGDMPLTAELYVSDYSDGPWMLVATQDAAATTQTLRGLPPGESRDIHLTFVLEKKTTAAYITVNFVPAPPAQPA